MIVLLVSVLGGLGAATRFMFDGWMRGRWSTGLPVATIVINVSGSLLIGFLAGGLAAGGITPNGYVVAATGFCGGYTTFSTATVETVRLAQTGAYRRAVVNAFGTLLLTVLAAAAGVAIAGVAF
ncbi:MAG: CrcB family protein [Brevundimonas sp.]